MNWALIPCSRAPRRAASAGLVMVAKSSTTGWPAGARSPQPQKIRMRPRGCWYCWGTPGAGGSVGWVGWAWGVTSGILVPAFRAAGGRCSAFGAPLGRWDEPS